MNDSQSEKDIDNEIKQLFAQFSPEEIDKAIKFGEGLAQATADSLNKIEK